MPNPTRTQPALAARALAPLLLALAACAPAARDGASARAAALPPDAPAGTSMRVAAPGGADRLPPPARGPLATPERTGYAETSSHADVLAFLDALERAGAPMARGEIGRTGQGRAIPYVVASRPVVASPEQARATGRPVVYVQGDIHGGEVEGKEALQMLLRDLLLDPRPNVLDSIVLVAVPIYNADGNDAVGPQARQRGAQHGPERIGQRPNAAGLDLNRDYVKAEAPETRASLAAFAAWAPDVFVDLHTTNGSYHGYALTYSPSLHPAAPLGRFTHDTLLPALQARVLARHGYPTEHYGNFDADDRRSLTDTTKSGWYTYDHRPRFGTNYYGLRGGVSVLAEAYSHDPFDRRVASTYAFVRELLSLVAEQGGALTARTRAADPAPGDVALRAALPETGPLAWITAERLASTGDSTVTEPGVPRGVRRTGEWRAIRMPSVVRFAPTMAGDVPAAWVLPPGDTAAVALLRLHGVRVERVDAPREADVRAYVVDSVARAARPFQGHREVRLEGGTWTTTTRRTVAAGSWWVPGDQRLARLALVLLDPRTDDGLVTWNHFDDRLRRGAEFPVVRVEPR